MRDFQAQIFKTCGVRCIVMCAHQDETGKIITALYVFRHYCPINNATVNVTGAKMIRSRMIQRNHLFPFALIGRTLKCFVNGSNMQRRYINQV